MKTFATLYRDFLRKTWLLIDYFIWVFIDFSKYKPINKEKIKNVVVIHLGAIGDILITTPLVKALKNEISGNVDFMLNKGKEVVFLNNSNVDKTILFSQDMKDNIRNLREGKYDLAVIISPGTEKSNLIAKMCRESGVKYNIGVFGSPRRGLSINYNRRIFPISNKHTVERNLNIIRKIGIDNPDPKLEFFISKADEDSAKSKLNQYKVNEYIVIHPGFGFIKEVKYPSRLWPIQKYGEFIDKFTQQNNIDVLITGSGEEKFLADSIYSLTKNKNKIKITNGNLNFGELGYVISKAKFVLTPGTSAVHLASSLNIPIIELVGKEELKEWHPWQDKNNYIALYHPEVCTGCNKLECRLKTTECLNTITVDEVVDASNKLLKKL